jgi:hypothetical protein
MPVDQSKAQEVWDRFQWMRDNGHLQFVENARKCDRFFAGLQWDPHDLALLKAQRRPALTINKILSTISTVLGEQIFNRVDISFQPRNEGATEEVAHALTKVFMQISDNNQLPWRRTDVFTDGLIMSRGFYDVRLDFSDSARGEVRIDQLNPVNVLIDPDADKYDPESWADVITQHWLSVDEVELLYSKADAKLLEGDQAGSFPYALDTLEQDRERFGIGNNPEYTTFPRGARRVRVLERQWRKLDNVLHFVDLKTGDMRPVPAEWDRQQIEAHLEANPEISTRKKLVSRIRWTVVAGSVVLHDDWSPYQHFTVVPYFPYFRHGRTIGVVENLLGPQELLNKTSSQELHVINTTANSGWKIKRGALTNMSVGELEQRGAQTGLVLELEDVAAAEKIQPNQVPTGLDRVAFKSEEYIDKISGVSDYMRGFAREDVAAKSVRANQQSGQANLAVLMDNLSRSDHMLARAILSLVQSFYTEERLVRITRDRISGEQETLTVNEVSPEGHIINDLTLGEYTIVVSSQPERDTFEDSQFDQMVAMRTEMGIQIPDKHIIQATKLRSKNQILEDMAGEMTPEQQEAAQRREQAELATLEAEAASKQADAQLKQAKTQREIMNAQKVGAEIGGAGGEENLDLIRMRMEFELKREEMQANIALKREEMQANIELRRQQAEADAQIRREQQAQQQLAQMRQPTQPQQ